MTAILDAPEIARDRWDRPLIRPANGGRPVGYTRVSGLAKALDDGAGLAKWAVGMTVAGLALDSELYAEAERLIAQNIDPADVAEGVLWDVAKATQQGTSRTGHPVWLSSRLMAIGAEAQEAAGSAVKRERGTTLHGYAELINTGAMTVDAVPAEHRADVEAYLWATAGLTILETELFVVVDEVQAAGTLDSLVLDGGRVRVGDLKTGQNDPSYPMSVEMQVALYAHGDRYDLATGERSPLHEDIDLEKGVLIHAPSRTGTCTLYDLDLKRGWDNVRFALDLKARRAAGKRKLTPRGAA